SAIAELVYFIEPHDQEKSEHAGPNVTKSHEGKRYLTRMIKRLMMKDDLKENSKIAQA
ncbi:hypothetical protein Tco_0885862, partial [Tanacetum coccineum]